MTRLTAEQADALALRFTLLSLVFALLGFALGWVLCAIRFRRVKLPVERREIEAATDRLLADLDAYRQREAGR